MRIARRGDDAARASGPHALVVDGHGALAVHLDVGRAEPLDERAWTDLASAPAMPAASAERLASRPAAQPLHLRWSGRWPEWFDHVDRRWVAVDAPALQAAVDQRAGLRPSAPAQAVAAAPIHPPARRDGDPRWPVWPVEYHERPQPNLALGLVLAAAAAEPDLAERFDLRPLGSARPSALPELAAAAPGVLLFSHYVWSTRGNLRQSAVAKEIDPRHLTVHGGPNAPGYPDDVERFLAEHPHVDVVVHGEGEDALVDLLRAVAASDALERTDPDRLAALASVPGVTVRVGDRAVRGPKRKRIADLDATPSPYLAGTFDDLDLAGTLAVVETNRGCPFGCTFCDWGSATRSRVRFYDVERVRGEIEWLAARGADGLFIADANFGAFDRDLEIAEAIAEAKRRHGHPRQVVFTFAKDTADLLIPIVDLLWDVGIDVDGNLALQTVDEPTLRLVRRKNLPVDDYRRVREQFHERGLPLTSDIMLGLPGATYESMRADVQFCLDHEITPRAHRTVLLPNAPMSAPAHRAEHGIEADHLQRTVAGTTFSADDLARVGNLHRLADAWDAYGIARLPLRFLGRDRAIPEVEVLERVDHLTRTDPERFPALTWAAVGFTAWMVPPGSWAEFLADLRRWIVEDLGVPDDGPLDAVLRAQAAVLPEPGATFPRRVELAHDVVAWLDQHRHDPVGPSRRPLGSFGPVEIEVDDGGRSDDLLRANRQARAHTGRDLRSIRRIYGPSWELASPLARPRMLDVEEHAFRYAT